MSTKTTAQTDSTVIDLSHSYIPYVKFTGTATGVSSFHDHSELASGTTSIWVNLGTMGLESNTLGNCDLSFTTANDFNLLNTSISANNTNLGGHSLGEYSLRYQNQVIGNLTNNHSLTLPCNNSATDIDFKLNRTFTLVGYERYFQEGVYQDTVNIEVTTQ